MKRKCFSIPMMMGFVLVLLTLHSCTTDDIVAEEQKISNKCLQTQVKGEWEWDESYHPNASTRSLSESYEFVPVGVKNVYTGMILKGEELNNGKIVPITEKADALGLVFTVPGFYIGTLRQPSYTSYMQEFKKALNEEDFSGQQIEEFEYDLKQFSKYSEMKLAFGSNVDICSILKLREVLNPTVFDTRQDFLRVCAKRILMV